MPLNKINFRNFLNMLFYNDILKILVKFDIRLLCFFSDNIFGYGFYLWCLFYGFFGCSRDDCTISHSLAALFVLFLFGLMLQTYILLKIPFTREYLENLVGQSYIEKYLGKYTGSEMLIKLFKYCGPVIAAAGAELLTANIEAQRQFEAAQQAQRIFDQHHKAAGSLPSVEELKQNADLQLEYVKKASNAKGIISRGFAAIHIKIES
jgi:hypothetical protein